jgi:hypothetical protein
MTGSELSFYEDIVVGVPERFGAYKVTREEVIDFAGRYDPQAFHLDDQAAAAGPFGTLAASGWNTAAIAMRLLVDNVLVRQAALGGAGVEEMRWTRPVLPGDVLTLEVTVTEKRRSQSRPENGIMKVHQRLLNQRGEEVLRMTTTGMIRVRNPGAPDPG